MVHCNCIHWLLKLACFHGIWCRFCLGMASCSFYSSNVNWGTTLWCIFVPGQPINSPAIVIGIGHDPSTVLLLLASMLILGQTLILPVFWLLQCIYCTVGQSHWSYTFDQCICCHNLVLGLPCSIARKCIWLSVNKLGMPSSGSSPVSYAGTGEVHLLMVIWFLIHMSSSVLIVSIILISAFLFQTRSLVVWFFDVVAFGASTFSFDCAVPACCSDVQCLVKKNIFCSFSPGYSRSVCNPHALHTLLILLPCVVLILDWSDLWSVQSCLIRGPSSTPVIFILSSVDAVICLHADRSIQMCLGCPRILMSCILL